MKWIVVIACLLLWSSSMLVFAENCKNENGNTCQRYGQFNRYCNKIDVGESKATFACVDQEDRTIGNTLSAHGSGQLNSRCAVDSSTGKNSYNIANRCRELAASGCDATNGNEVSCSNLATRTNVDGKTLCVAKENTISGIKVGGLCGNGTAFNCGPNAVCNSLRHCEPASKVGEHCGSGYSSCVVGSTCFNRYCVAAHSVDDWQPCNTDVICKSKWCNTKTGMCQPAVSKSCYFNHECPGLSSCVDASESQQGRCAMHVGKQFDLLNCIASRCAAPYGSNDFSETCAMDNCRSEWIQSQCQSQCVKSEDLRYNLDLEYSFDCEAITATAWKDLDLQKRCGLADQFINCDKANYIWDN